ncbi:MAG: ATP synthase subunit I [Steroidobacteraceae bacterium]
MLEAESLLQAAIAGAALGGIFFVGLWWTVQLGTLAKNPAPWFLVSLLLRVGVILGGFYFVGGRDWHRLAACAVGFAAARVIALSWLSARGRPSRAPEIPHAP